MKKVLFALAVLLILPACTSTSEVTQAFLQQLVHDFGSNAEITSASCRSEWDDDEQEWDCHATVDGVRYKYECEVHFGDVYCEED